MLPSMLDKTARMPVLLAAILACEYTILGVFVSKVDYGPGLGTASPNDSGPLALTPRSRFVSELRRGLRTALSTAPTDGRLGTF